MNITILGLGNIGGTLGKKWASAGHRVIFGTRDANSRKAQALREAFPAARIDTVANALADAEVILMAITHSNVAETVNQYASAFAGKIVIDATNNFSAPIVNNLGTILAAAPTAQVFRAFNSLGWELFANPIVEGKAIDHFYCRPDNDKRPIVDQLITEIGAHPVWVGGNETIGIVDALGSLWVTLVFQRGYPRHLALRLVQR
jgi:8-hydroxy-5-deazaflavin:NADPH oxidoreductase